MDDLGIWADILNGVETLARPDVVGKIVAQVVPEPTGKRGRYKMRNAWTLAGHAVRANGRAIAQAAEEGRP
jgi:hypothetical protein